jgi:hypothetical protein
MSTQENDSNNKKNGFNNWMTGTRSNNMKEVVKITDERGREEEKNKEENKEENKYTITKSTLPSVNTADVLSKEVKDFEKSTNGSKVNAALFGKQAFELAGTIAVTSAAGQAIVAGLAATGVGLPIAGLLGIILLLANKLALLFYYNLQLHSTLLDVLNIVSNCFRLNDLINYTTGIFTIYFFGGADDNNNLIDNLNTLNGENKGVYKLLLEKALEKKNNELEKVPDPVPAPVLESSSTQPQQGEIAMVKIIEKGGNPNDEEDKLIKWIRPNVAIQQRLFDKLNDLTTLLLIIATDDMIRTLYADTQIMESGMSNLIEKVYKDRDLKTTEEKKNMTRIGRFTRAFGRNSSKFVRGFNRFTNGQFLNQQLINELTLVNGFFMLMKAQYDMTIDYYERSMSKEDWTHIWKKYIQNSSVYIEYLVPSDISKTITEGRLNISKEEMELASTEAITIIIEKKTEAAKAIDEKKSTEPEGGGKRKGIRKGNKTRKRIKTKRK